MAVIKIVPMPGAVGDKGDEGAPGPQGPQGQQGLQGPAGADAAWYYNGEYNPGASYVVGDVVTFEGQTWYRKHANGGNVGDTPSVGPFWDLIAAKAENAVTSTSGTWDSEFLSLSQITAPNYSEIATYYTIGDLVYFNFIGNIGIITSTTDHLEWFTTNAETYTTSSQFRLKLPFTTLGPVYFVGNMFDNSYDTDYTLKSAGGRYAVFGRSSNSDILYLEVSSPITLAREGEPGIMVGEIFPLSAKFPFDMTESNSGNGNYVRISGTYRSA
jgi:hypothetical protein